MTSGGLTHGAVSGGPAPGQQRQFLPHRRGMETQFIFLDGIELPEFASFVLFKRKGGESMLRRYYESYVALAERFRTGLVLESSTWRANADWGARLGYGAKE